MIEVAFFPTGSTRPVNGVNRTIDALVRELEATGAVRPRVLRDDRRVRVPGPLARLGTRVPPSRRVLRRFDVVHVPAERIHHPSRFADTRLVVTVTGLGGLSGAYESAAAERADLEFVRAFERLRRSTTVVTGSAAARAHVCDRLGLANAEVHVIPLGVDHRLFHPRAGDEPARVLAGGVELRPPFVVHVGQFSARKNSSTLLDAFGIVARSTGAPPTLALVGRVDRAAALAAARAVGVEDRVVITGPISDALLAEVYRNAAAVCVPSRYEGFGLPVIEAMASGAPVVISGSPALVEVAGGAAAVVDDADDPEALADALTGVLETPESAGRLRRDGLARAAQFSWPACARRHLELYEGLVRL